MFTPTHVRGDSPDGPRHRARRTLAPFLLILALVFAACGNDTDDAAKVLDDAADQVDDTNENASELADALRERGLDTLASAVESVDMSELVGDGEFTFFAPNNDAFLSLDADTTADLLTDPAKILETLKNHVMSERIEASELAGVSEIETRGGNSFVVSADGSATTIGEATVTEADIDVGNGVVHVVDTLLIP